MPDADPNVADEIRERMAVSPFHTWMGMRVLAVREGEVDLALDAEPHHLNLQGSVHGGVLATLADTAAGLAVRSVIEPGSRHVSINLDVQYLRGARGGTVIARGRVLRAGRSVAFADAEVADEEGTVLARAQVTVAVSPAAANPG